ncbi:MAG: Stp1/IreP family PP2C-type Ser/Thr phosphatase [Bacilli bacterium]|nr:Stp1/IreP family PP2C-type Ser/Thr phosphatase [Bacilli bacterium]MBP3635314.1 Stp1/IreP family PP2C-type Ser/Thr phosphatase [Bacilli bacterium]
MKSFFLTDTGKVRDHNEDSVTILKNAHNEYLLAVADGMGGHKAGEVASQMAINHITNRFKELEKLGEKSNAVNWIREEVAQINKSIFEYTAIHEESKGMGTTFVAALITKDYLLFANVGDSSGFVIKGEKLYRVTKPHTLVNLLVQSGELTEEEAEHHPRKNILMRALGANNPAEVDIFDVDTDVDAIMLCSDGLTTMLNNTQIEKVLTGVGSLEEKVTKLIRKSNIRGGTDNISIACLAINEEGAI